MSISFTSDDLRRLQLTLETCLTPLAHGDPEAWGEAVVGRCVAMLDADSAIAWIPTANGGRPYTVGARAQESIPPYLHHFIHLDSGFTRYRAENHLSVYSSDGLRDGYTTEAWRELREDWLQPYRLLDSLGMAVPCAGSPFPFLVHVYHDRAGGRRFGARGQAMLGLVLPAFRAGLAALRRVVAWENTIIEMIDELATPALVYTARGSVTHESPTAAELLARDAQSSRVRAAARRLAMDVGSRALGKAARDLSAVVGARPKVEVATEMGRYSIVASLIPVESGHREPLIVTMVQRQARRELSNDEMRQAFGLTRRECDVVRMLALGRSNRETALELGISVHTAERHTERVLQKLGVNRRGAVAAKLSAM